jgi:hypothetical protein
MGRPEPAVGEPVGQQVRCRPAPGVKLHFDGPALKSSELQTDKCIVSTDCPRAAGCRAWLQLRKPGEHASGVLSIPADSCQPQPAMAAGFVPHATVAKPHMQAAANCASGRPWQEGTRGAACASCIMAQLARIASVAVLPTISVWQSWSLQIGRVRPFAAVNLVLWTALM